MDEQILILAEQVRSAASCLGGIPQLTDPAARWAAEQVVANRHVPMNGATKAALESALAEMTDLQAA